MRSMRLQGGGGKDRKSLHILSCQAWDEDRVGGWEACSCREEVEKTGNLCTYWAAKSVMRTEWVGGKH
jgi:hypothetical protein